MRLDERRMTKDERTVRLVSLPNQLNCGRVVSTVITLFLASSAFAWPWSSGEKKSTAEDQARIKDSLQM